MTVSTLPVHLMKDASGLVNLIRNVGGAVGLAVLATALNTRTAEHLADLSANLTITSQRGQMMMVLPRWGHAPQTRRGRPTRCSPLLPAARGPGAWLCGRLRPDGPGLRRGRRAGPVRRPGRAGSAR